MKGKKTGGRKKGVPNRATREAKEFCASIVDDVQYQETVRKRAMKGKLPPAVECMLWHYAKGRPTETMRLQTDVPLALQIEMTDAFAPHPEPRLP
jgi:hypothetical protein